MSESSKEARAIVSSEHLSHSSRELSELEFGLILSSHAFSRWVVHCMTAAGLPELGSLDILVLHRIYNRNRPKRLADICLVLNIEDSHTVSYSLKKLSRLNLIEGNKQGKETFFSTTEEGKRICTAYAEIRETCLIESLSSLGIAKEDLHHVANVLRTLSGLYDQASRSAASI